MQENIQIEDGTYTVNYPDGSHRTLKVTTIKGAGFFGGKQKIGYLSGPDNEAHYTWVGHFEGGRLKIWQRAGMDELREQRFRRAVATVAGDTARAGLLYALRSGNCYVCGRKLTHPDSLEDGRGPECRRRANRTAAQRRRARVA